MFVKSFGPTPAPIESGEKMIEISMPKYIITKEPAPLDWARVEQPLLIPGVVSGWILKFADDGLWGKLSALGIVMILISTTLVVLATVVGSKMSKVKQSG